MFQKRHMDRLANGLAIALRYPPAGGTERERQAWRNGFREAAEAVADELQGNSGYTGNGNRRFDRDRFLSAVGLGPTESNKEVP